MTVEFRKEIDTVYTNVLFLVGDREVAAKHSDQLAGLAAKTRLAPRQGPTTKPQKRR